MTEIKCARIFHDELLYEAASLVVDVLQAEREKEKEGMVFDAKTFHKMVYAFCDLIMDKYPGNHEDERDFRRNEMTYDQEGK